MRIANSRFNTNLQLNYNPGKVNLFGSYGYRQDYRQSNRGDSTWNRYLDNDKVMTEEFIRKLDGKETLLDLFNSRTYKSNIDTPILIQESTRRRDAPVFYAGFVFNFGSNGKKAKAPKFEFDNGAVE